MGTAADIRLLSDHVINKIAAGEVVERPASVLKELMENAIDADSCTIDVAVVAGGRKLVSVTDDGSGMNRDNALLAIERHATSKLRHVEEIETIHTLGFRGEALAAIGAVSRLRILTCARGESIGTELTVVGGTLQQVRETGGPPGTILEVRDLFYNVPARRKFLRTDQTELGHLRTTFLVEALSHPELAMSLRVDDRPVYQLAACKDAQERIVDVFGREIAGQLLSLDEQIAGMRILGYISKPSLHRADRSEQYFFINGRPAGAPVLTYAVREALRDVLAADRHPYLVLYLTLDPGLVDVNVHPTKRDVRFRRNGEVRDAVIAAIRKHVGSLPAAEAAPAGGADAQPSALRFDRQLSIPDLPPAPVFHYPKQPVLTSPDFATPCAESAPAPQTEGTAGESIPMAPWMTCRLLGQIGGYYVLLETEEGFVVLDPRAAHERVLYEQYLDRVQQHQVEQQALLLPETVELSVKDASRLQKLLPILADMGFRVSAFGAQTYLIEAVPASFGVVPAARLLLDMLQGLDWERAGKSRHKQEELARLACRSAIAMRQKLSLAEIEQLLVDLVKTRMPYTSPRGRPTMILTPFQELDRKFGRS